MLREMLCAERKMRTRRLGLARYTGKHTTRKTGSSTQNTKCEVYL